MGLFKTVHQHYKTLPDNIQIKEVKAPTDESVRLLKEMQDKTLESIIEILPVVNNDITFIIAPMQDPLNMGKWIVKVTINGIEHGTVIQGLNPREQISEKIIQWLVS